MDPLDYKDYWIGMNDFSQRGQFKWTKSGSDPYKAGFVNWAKDYPVSIFIMCSLKNTYRVIFIEFD